MRICVVDLFTSMFLLTIDPILHHLQKPSRKSSVVGTKAQEEASVAAASYRVAQESRRPKLKSRPTSVVSEPGPDELMMKDSREKYDSVQEILVELTGLCDVDDCEHEQRLLRNMGAHSVVLELLQVPYNKVSVCCRVHAYSPFGL